MSRVFETYEDAREAIEDEESQMVCGVRLEDDSARYFILPRTADDDTGYERAFEIRHGRPMSAYERWLRNLVMSRKAEEVPA